MGWVSDQESSSGNDAAPPGNGRYCSRRAAQSLAAHYRPAAGAERPSLVLEVTSSSVFGESDNTVPQPRVAAGR
jgi:hypothetical protein